MRRMAVVELLATIRPVFQQAIESVAWDEDLTWDLQWALVPTPTGPVTSYLCYVHCPALHVLGAFLQRTFMVPIGTPSLAIERMVIEQIEGLRSERSRLLAEATNGGPVPGNIILP
jgi:hypothetical protein